ncbi:MAG: SDR family NAD(P)-dependent oxidoreductase, partial [Alphaproteobacteria bacterium]
MARLEGKVALITGGGGGMGRADSLLLADLGADVIVHDLAAERAHETARLVIAKGRRALALAGDVADAPRIAAEIARAEGEMGRIDVLVNNAGIGGQYFTIDEIDEAIFERMFAVHVRGAFFATRAVVPGMKRRRAGKIINISSNWGMAGNANSSHYCGAKAALLGLTKAWAKELAPHNICVNAIAPGWVDTGMGSPEEKRKAAERIPLRRLGRPEEVAHAVAFLASSES